MTGNGLQLIQEYYKSFNQKDWKTFLDLLDTNVAHEINQGEVEKGIPAFEAFIARMNQSYDEQITNISFLSDEGGVDFAARYTVEGKYLKTDPGLPSAKGQRYSLPGGAFFKVKNGKIQSITNYYNLPEWIKQVQ